MNQIQCWFADNKVSSERHEQGVRHKAMVQQRIRESSKKAQEREVEVINNFSLIKFMHLCF